MLPPIIRYLEHVLVDVSALTSCSRTSSCFQCVDHAKEQQPSNLDQQHIPIQDQLVTY